MPIERVSTGIKGLDDLIEGGFPMGTNVLVTGGPGTGKSILCLQYLISGASKGEPGVYLTLEDRRENIIKQAMQFGWDIDVLENEKKLLVKSVKVSDIEDIMTSLKKDVNEIKAKRVVIDSLSMMSVYARVLDKVSRGISSSEYAMAGYDELSRAQIAVILRKLGELGTTNLIIAEDLGASDKIAEFLADGVIQLEMNLAMKTRSLSAFKMRGTKLELGKNVFEFTNEGINLSR